MTGTASSGGMSTSTPDSKALGGNGWQVAPAGYMDRGTKESTGERETNDSALVLEARTWISMG